MTSGSETPSTAKWLHKKFLETVLRKGDNTPTLKVTSYDVKPAVGKGDNYTSDLYRVKIHTADGKVFNLIVKKELAAEGELGKVLQKSSAFLRETHMYRSAAVRLANILQEMSPGECSQFAARYLYSCPGTIVMQDLRAEGFKMAERRQGLDFSHCLLVMRMLARFHAASVVLHDRDLETMSLYDKNFFSDPEMKEGLQKFVSGTFRTVVKAVQTWPGFADRYAGKLDALADSMLDRIIQVSQRDDTALNVLIHGDLWVNNILFRYSDGPVDVRFVDFQLLHFTSPAIDLQYFFSTSPCEDVRENHLDSLMKEYHNTLCECLNAMGYSHKHITLEDLWKEYNNKALYGLFGACCVLPIVLADKGFDIDAILKSGIGEEIEVVNGDTYKKALQRMLPKFEEDGVFRSGESLSTDEVQNA
ncbi:uncharacterized protein LOC111874986 [Cryptotermes secundus]|nr:uncharacterized protein LOC111874986 [Cryptotermes secundus]XP_023726684.1 uncharacterized protein LOC111874986 [Cryptotermes secundus]